MLKDVLRKEIKKGNIIKRTLILCVSWVQKQTFYFEYTVASAVLIITTPQQPAMMNWLY